MRKPLVLDLILVYISNKIQRYTVYFIWKLLYVFRVIASPIIRSAINCIYSIWYLSHRYCYLPLLWKSWNWFECAVGGNLSSGAQTTESTAAGICHPVIAICRYYGRVGTGLSVLWVVTHHQERKQLYLQHLVFVTTLLLSAAIVEELELVWVCCGWRSNSSTIAADSNNVVTNTRCCRYSCLRSWWWVMVPPETCRAVCR